MVHGTSRLPLRRRTGSGSGAISLERQSRRRRPGFGGEGRKQLLTLIGGKSSTSPKPGGGEERRTPADVRRGLLCHVAFESESARYHSARNVAVADFSRLRNTAVSCAFVAQRSFSAMASNGRIFFAGVGTTFAILAVGFGGGLMLAKTRDVAIELGTSRSLSFSKSGSARHLLSRARTALSRKWRP